MSPPEVIVRLMGGLGNQLFEYAAARAVAHRNGLALKLDALSGFSRDHLYQRHLKIDRFRLAAGRARPDECFEGPLGRVRRIMVKALERRRPWSRRRYLQEEPGRPAGDLTALRVNHSLYMDGLWQSEQYFEDVAPLLRGELRLRDEEVLRLGRLGDEIRAVDSISVHVRRLFIAPGAKRPVPVEDDAPLPHLTRRPYYEAAIERLGETVSTPHFFVFSDHPVWARNNLRFPGRATFVESPPSPDQDLRDLRLISLCRHHIVAASTFSWWGAWLSNSPCKRVLAPRSGWGHSAPVPTSWETI